MPYSVSAGLVDKHKTNNPFDIASKKNIMVIYGDLGDTLGFFFSERRIRFIHINNELEYMLQRFVCAHELGHAVLHPKINTPFMQKNTFYSVDRIEKEANTFAVCMLTHNVQPFDSETKEQYCLRNNIPIEMVSYL